jgi:hypothetical protein
MVDEFVRERVTGDLERLYYKYTPMPPNGLSLKAPFKMPVASAIAKLSESTHFRFKLVNCLAGVPYLVQHI